MEHFRIWQVSREYAGIAEAGGVKNVTTSLCEELSRQGHEVLFFIPLYGCTCFDSVEKYEKNFVPKVAVTVCGKAHDIAFDRGFCNGVTIIFVKHQSFAEKNGVYTYTVEDEKKVASHVHGTGFSDALFLNTLFQKAVLAFSEVCDYQAPDILHCQDATTALIPAFLQAFSQSPENPQKKFFAKTKCVVTVHNAGAGYHHHFSNIGEAAWFTELPTEMLEKAVVYGAVEPFLLSSQNAVLTTVSPSYAKELLNPNNEATGGLSRAFYEKKIKIIGITNGIDFDRYNPEHTEISLLPFAFAPEKGQLLGKYHCRQKFLEEYVNPDFPVPAPIIRYGHIDLGLASDVSEPVYVGFHGRLVSQKGIDILVGAADEILKNDSAVRFIFIGHGEARIESALAELSEKYAGKCVYFKGYDRALSRLCTAVSDFIALPSCFEPCGLEDFIAQIYGSVPVAHATGGLNKIIDGQTGFLYSPNTVEKLTEKLREVIKIKQEHSEAFRNMISTAANYVHKMYSWSAVCRDSYLPLYRKLLHNR